MQCHFLDDGAARDLRYVLTSLRCKLHCFAIPQILILVFFITAHCYGGKLAFTH